MTDSTRLLGPRGWAVLVLASGAALSAPFLRNPQNPARLADSTGNPSEVDFSKKSWPDVREKTLTPEGPLASNLSQRDWEELERLKANSASGPRKVTGSLPSTSATTLPAWADRGPRIDQLVNESIRNQPLAPTPVGTVQLDPLRPWMGSGMRTNAGSSASIPQGEDLAGDFTFKTPNPDSRWNSVPATVLNDDASQPDSGALAGNQPYRKFEDHVKQWPDEKLSPSQVAWDKPRFSDSIRNPVPSNAVVANSPSWPTVQQSSVQRSSTQQSSASQASGFPVANQSTIPPATSPVYPPAVSLVPHVESTPQLDSVNAPMVSSQSNRQPPRLSSPKIEVPVEPLKPAANAPRPKYFIQQPTKRA